MIAHIQEVDLLASCTSLLWLIIIGKRLQIGDIAKNENLPLEVIQLDVNNDKSVTDAINRIAEEKIELIL